MGYIFVSNSIYIARRMLIFGENINFNITQKYLLKNCQNVINFLCILLFCKFLCISLFFQTFVFYCFFDELCRGLFCNHKQHEINPFKPAKVKIIIHLWYFVDNTICIDFVHEITFLSNFPEPRTRVSQIWFIRCARLESK